MLKIKNPFNFFKSQHSYDSESIVLTTYQDKYPEENENLVKSIKANSLSAEQKKHYGTFLLPPAVNPIQAADLKNMVTLARVKQYNCTTDGKFVYVVDNKDTVKVQLYHLFYYPVVRNQASSHYVVNILQGDYKPGALYVVSEQSNEILYKMRFPLTFVKGSQQTCLVAEMTLAQTANIDSSKGKLPQIHSYARIESIDQEGTYYVDFNRTVTVQFDEKNFYVQILAGAYDSQDSYVAVATGDEFSTVGNTSGHASRFVHTKEGLGIQRDVTQPEAKKIVDQSSKPYWDKYINELNGFDIDHSVGYQRFNW